MIRVTNLKLNLDDAMDYASEIANLRKLVISKYNIKPNQLLLIRIYKKAIDARRKSNVHFVFTIDMEVANEAIILNKNHVNVSKTPDLKYQYPKSGTKELMYQPVIVGFGPAGIFAALILSRNGYDPIILERGQDVDKRTEEWNRFIETREFIESASIQFGEGGAGTFSDGKLTTLINDTRCYFILSELVKAGAHPEILYVNRPHVGTDVLKTVIKHIRNEITKNGGTIRFGAKVTDFVIEDNQLKGVVINEKETINTNICLLGIGHSARDTFQLIYEKQMSLEPKAFSVGMRIEHLQRAIDKAQYGPFASHPALGPADYKLSYHSANGRSAYTFCMCPGGYVVNATSEPEMVVTNGMSYSKRDHVNANSAVLVNVTPKDFKEDHPLAGVWFQQDIERKAYQLGGSNYNAPMQLVGDFLKNKNSTNFNEVTPTYLPGYQYIKMDNLLPKFVIDTLREAIPYFDTKIQGFANKDAVLTGPETRSSSPVRMIRDDNHQSNILGIYPMGEGAGYAGGIMSSAVDGMKTAEKIIQVYEIF